MAGIFDFHDGPNCEILRGSESIALPLAFSYAVASYTAQKQIENSLFSGLEFGAILVDGCSSDRKIMEFLVESENGCYRFTQAERNWTIVSGSTFGKFKFYITHTYIKKNYFKVIFLHHHRLFRVLALHLVDH